MGQLCGSPEVVQDRQLRRPRVNPGGGVGGVAPAGCLGGRWLVSAQGSGELGAVRAGDLARIGVSCKAGVDRPYPLSICVVGPEGRRRPAPVLGAASGRPCSGSSSTARAAGGWAAASSTAAGDPQMEFMLGVLACGRSLAPRLGGPGLA